MKIIDSHIRAQSMFGSNASLVDANSRHPFTGSGWTAFLMPGSFPSTEAQVEERFNKESLADLYNKCVGVSRGILNNITQADIVHLIPQARYDHKGVSYFKTIGAVDYRLLMPNSIDETAVTKRTVTHILAGESLGTGGAWFSSETFDSGDMVVEFDTEVNLTHLYRNGGGSMIFKVSALDTDNTATSLGTFTTDPADPNLFIAANPQTAKRFILSAVASSNSSMNSICLLSKDQPYSDNPETLPKWLVLAHTNTRVCGDHEYSLRIPYLAEFVSQGSAESVPFTLRRIDMQNENVLFCPKMRFANRSNR